MLFKKELDKIDRKSLKWSEMNTNKYKFRTRVKHRYYRIKNNILNQRLNLLTYSRYVKLKNSEAKDYEKLQFSVNTIRDESPTISVTSNIDSISRGPAYFAGQISDDYGFSKLEMVYYDIQNPVQQNFKSISISRETVQSFFSSFPDDLNLKEQFKWMKPKIPMWRHVQVDGDFGFGGRLRDKVDECIEKLNR